MAQNTTGINRESGVSIENTKQVTPVQIGSNLSSTPISATPSISSDGQTDLRGQLFQDNLRFQKELKQDIEKFKKKWTQERGELLQELSEGKYKTVETLGVFVALFTFVSIQFQVFNYMSTIGAMRVLGTSIIFSGMIMMFPLLLGILLKKENNLSGKEKVILGIIIFLTFTGLCIFFKNPEAHSATPNNEQTPPLLKQGQ